MTETPASTIQTDDYEEVTLKLEMSVYSQLVILAENQGRTLEKLINKFLREWLAAN